MSEISLDDARDSLFAMQRACERFAAHLATTLTGLEGKKDGIDLWMETLLEEANRARIFHEGQVQLASDLTSRMEVTISSVRLQADSDALSELKGQEKEGRTIHPELQKFKLEKQAKILGKYGGVASPLLMAGGAQKSTILKATASAAAVEIHYSKIEDKDARQLAQVMQFKKDKGVMGGSTPCEGGKSESIQPQWQEETVAKKGNKDFFKNLQGPEIKVGSSPSHCSPYGNELMAKLRERQNLEQAAAANAVGTPPSSHLRQNKEDEDLHKKPFGGVTLRPAAAASGVVTPASSNATGHQGQPGSELAEILRRRQERQGSSVDVDES